MVLEEYKKYIPTLIAEGKRGDIDALSDALSLCKGLEELGVTLIGEEETADGGRIFDKGNFGMAHDYSVQIRKYAADVVQLKGSSDALELYYRTMTFDAPYNFDVFLRAIEFKQDEEKHFYSPRRHYLKRYVDAYQQILDGKIRFLSVSMPKRAGKSQLGILFTMLLSGRFPDRSSLMEGTGKDLVDSFYKGCLEYLDRQADYGFYDIYPHCRVVGTNADTDIINLVTKNRFPTVMCRSIDARQVGLSEASNLLYLDDCVEGREEAKNRQRLDEKWEVISGDIMGRALEGVPIVICGTRYSLYDPIGRLQEYAEAHNWSRIILETPALTEDDESNFEYYNPKTGSKMFTADYFKEQRDLLTEEQWMSEFQQQPFEAKGQLFPETRLQRYFELPVDREPDSIIAACDTSEGKGDSTMMPVAYIYGDDVFIHDCVFNDAPPEVTKPECARVIRDNNVTMALFESNLAGTYYARDVEKLVRELGGMCSIRTRYSSQNKRTRIEFASDNILKHFYFKDKSLYTPSSEYGRMIKELVSYTRTGKVKHDDSPDGLALLENVIRTLVFSQVTVLKRMF